MAVQVREGVVGVGGLVEGTSRGIGGLVEGTGRGIGKGFGTVLGGRREEGRAEPPPTLDRLLSTESLSATSKPARDPTRFSSPSQCLQSCILPRLPHCLDFL